MWWLLPSTCLDFLSPQSFWGGIVQHSNMCSDAFTLRVGNTTGSGSQHCALFPEKTKNCFLHILSCLGIKTWLQSTQPGGMANYLRCELIVLTSLQNSVDNTMAPLHACHANYSAICPAVMSLAN